MIWYIILLLIKRLRTYLRVTLSILILLSCDGIFSQDVNRLSHDINYILSITPLNASTTLSDDEPHDIRYFDGLGRLSQRVLYKASPDTSKSIVSLIEYYNLSSIAKQWLPASMNNGTSMAKYRDTSAVKTSSRATNNNDQKPFSYSQYDNTPLNRLTKHYGAGLVWQNP